MLRKIVVWGLIIIVFLVLSIAILIAAQGYKVNWMKFTLSQTSLVWLKGNEKHVEVFLDNKKVADKLPIRLNYVPEGWREVRITKNGYYTWQKSFYATNGQAYELRNILLFKKNNIPVIVNDQDIINSLKNNVLPLNISVENGEMRANGELVTRFFASPVSYQWYNDGQHIIFQVDKYIRVIDLDGTNDNVLADLNSDQPSSFRLLGGGKVLLYTDGDVVKKAQIR